MKFLFISRAMGIYRGGTESYELGLANELRKNGHIVEFLIGAAYAKKIIKIEEFNIYVCKSLFLKDVAQKIFSFDGLILNRFAYVIFKLDNYFFTRKCLKFFKNDLMRSNYDVIQVSGQINLSHKIKKITDSKVITFFPGMPDIREIKYIKNLDGVFTDGHAYDLIKEFHKNAKCIPGGINDKIRYDKKGNAEIKKKFSIKEEFILLMVNRLVPLKNINLGINIAEKLKRKKIKFKLLILGEGPEKSKFKKIIKDKQLQNEVKLIGFIDNYEIYKYYSAADIFLITSRFDNFPNVVKEAMFVGVPIVASNNSGLKMQVESGENGFLCESEEEFLSAIINILGNEDLIVSIKANNEKKARQEYAWGNNYNNYINLINNTYEK